MTIRIVLGRDQRERQVDNADQLLLNYRKVGDLGYEYIMYRPLTPVDQLLPEDLAVTLLVNSRAGYRAFQSLRDNTTRIDLTKLPDKAFEDTTDAELRVVVELVSRVAGWPGFAASLATKVLHKKRPRLIPLLDNQAIFGAYLNENWPRQPSWRNSVKSAVLIEEAMRSIRDDIRRPENRDVWPMLQCIEPSHSLIELFDCVWWVYFRGKESANGQLR